MHSSQSSLLSRALQSLDTVCVDYHNYGKNKELPYNFETLGRITIAKRALAEILGLNLKNFKLPGEDPSDYETHLDMFIFTNPSTSQMLTPEERRFIFKNVLQVLDKVSGVQDADDSCLRCAPGDTVKYTIHMKEHAFFK